MKKILLVAGARPNFIKIAPLMKEFKKHAGRFELLLVHTGQHYDFEMSEAFFQDLNIPNPDIYLNVGSASHAVQVAKIMIGFERVLSREKPGLVVVVGDVNSTLACSLVAAKLKVKESIHTMKCSFHSKDRSFHTKDKSFHSKDRSFHSKDGSIHTKFGLFDWREWRGVLCQA